MRINYNVQAMNANLALNKADNRVSQSIGKLSSGLKVASAKDSPSGYALSKRMNMQIEGISRATQSSNDAINIISIADGALQEVSDMVNRINNKTISVLMRGQVPDVDLEMQQAPMQQAPRRRPQYTESRTDLTDPAQRAAAARDTREQQGPVQPIIAEKLPGRNDPCPCGSGKKFKNCHGRGL